MRSTSIRLAGPAALFVLGACATKLCVSRFTAAGAVDTSFNTTGEVSTAYNAPLATAPNGVLVQPDNSIVFPATDASNAYVVRYLEAGTLDKT